MLTNAETYSGATTVNQGVLDLSGNGTLLPVATATPALTVSPGATLLLDNSGTNNVNRLVDASATTLTGGNLVFLGAAGAASSENLGNLNISSAASIGGNSVISTTAGAGGTAQLLFASLTRNTGSDVIFQTVNPLLAPFATLTPTQAFTQTLTAASVSPNVDSIAFTTALTAAQISGNVGTTGIVLERHDARLDHRQRFQFQLRHRHDDRAVQRRRPGRGGLCRLRSGGQHEQ